MTAARPGVLLVCTGNVCRSPAAEMLLRDGLGPDAGLAVSSAGLAARVGEPVAAPMARMLGDRGVPPGSFAARQVTPDLLRAATVVLTMTAEQRAAVVSRAPAVLRRTFTLREFADLAVAVDVPVDGGRPAERLAALVSAVPRARGARVARPGADDIEDPYRRPDAVFAAVLGRIAAAVGVLVDRLAPAGPHPG
ncbi:hypothetical protein ACI8AC_03350 [Geodermatophilus sp. SYSU D00758]